MQVTQHLVCPCCNSSSNQFVLSVKDYTVSKQLFEVWQCHSCSLQFTQAAPTQTHIGAFYQSENYISHTDTTDGIVNKIYHWVRNFTLQSKAALLKKYTETTKGFLLDIGAGTGAFSHVMQLQGWQVMGLEPDDTARKMALNKYQLALQLPNTLYTLQQQFNAITLWHVLEHVHDLHGYFKRFAALLAPNGKLFIAVPNYTSTDASHYKAHWAAYDVPRHLYHFSPQSMQVLAAQYGLEIIAYKPMWFDSVYVSLLSESYKTGKQHFIKALYHGLVSNIYTLFNAKKCSSIIYIMQQKTL